MIKQLTELLFGSLDATNGHSTGTVHIWLSKAKCTDEMMIAKIKARDSKAPGDWSSG